MKIRVLKELKETGRGVENVKVFILQSIMLVYVQKVVNMRWEGEATITSWLTSTIEQFHSCSICKSSGYTV